MTMEKKCTNCADVIVCWGFDEPNNEKAKDCPDWHLDFMTFQELYEEKDKMHKTRPNTGTNL